MLRVVSYNVEGLRGDRAALVEVVRELAPDVLVLQQAPRRLRWRTRTAQLAHAVDLVYATGGAPALGNVIMTNLRVRPYRTWELRFPLTPGRCLRGAAFARCTVAGAAFVLVGSHLATDPAERPGQAELLKKALCGHSSASAPLGGTPDRMTTADLDAPVIFCGDLNETPGGGAWRTLAEGLIDAAGPEAPYGPEVLPGRGSEVIFVDPRIAVTGYQVVDSAAARRASDHPPVVVDLELPG